MKHIVWALIAVLAVAGGTGCNKMHRGLLHKNKACSQCGGQGCPACGQGAAGHAGQGGHHNMNASYNQNGDPHYYGGQGQGGACPHCGPNGGGGGAGFGQGPGQVVYPYYTTRGPRDFLQNNPPELGP